MRPHTSVANRALQKEMQDLYKSPLEGFVVTVDEENIFKWKVAIFGPPKTIYQGGYFKALLSFPSNYPYSPPTVRFLTKLWHPNIYPDGQLCISILHPPGEDPHSGELPCERWNPTQNVRTILLSVISLLNEPNVSSPANIDASVSYRKWKESNGTNNEYATIVKRQVEASKQEAAKDNVSVPETEDDYCIKAQPKQPDDDAHDVIDLDEDYYGGDDSDNDSDYAENDEDSGQGEN